jgi:hypothetical protein
MYFYLSLSLALYPLLSGGRLSDELLHDCESGRLAAATSQHGAAQLSTESSKSQSQLQSQGQPTDQRNAWLRRVLLMDCFPSLEGA